MTAIAPGQSKITYTSASVDWELFHRQFDEALAHARGQLGRDYPLYIAGEAVTSPAPPIVDRSPIDTAVVLGRFAAATPAHVDRAVSAARAAQPAWAHRGWRERVAIMRRAAGLVRERKFELAAIMSLEVGKSRVEAMGDAEESADLIDYYCQQVEDANGFVRQMARVTPVEHNTDVLRPYGCSPASLLSTSRSRSQPACHRLRWPRGTPSSTSRRRRRRGRGQAVPDLP